MKIQTKGRNNLMKTQNDGEINWCYHQIQKHEWRKGVKERN